MSDSPFEVVAELSFDPATDVFTAETCPGRPCSPECDHAVLAPRPAPGDRVRHTITGWNGTVLTCKWEWPTYLRADKWTYVRFDNGAQNYIPNDRLAPPRGCQTFS